jgi:hypothetical protein
VCGHAKTEEYSKEGENASDNCPACGNQGTFGPAKVWFRPVGFAHPIDVPAKTKTDDVNETARATRAKLTMQTPTPEKDWTPIGKRVRGFPARDFLLVSNTGLENDGYDYCTDCGRIELTAEPDEFLWQPHDRPFRSDEDGPCQGNFTRRNVVLGTDFKTDLALFSRNRCERPTVLTASPLALFRRALRFGLEQSFGTKSATFVGFGWEQHRPA